MTAENTESTDASGGEDLRARYLPVSRKELRRRREAELAAERGATGASEEDAATPEPAAADAAGPDDAEQHLPPAASAQTPGEAPDSDDPEDPSVAPVAEHASEPEPEPEPEPAPEPWGFTSPVPTASATATSPTATVPDQDPLDEEDDEEEDDGEEDGEGREVDAPQDEPGTGAADDEAADLDEVDSEDVSAEDEATDLEDTQGADDDVVLDDTQDAGDAELDEDEVSGAEDAGLPEERAEAEAEEFDDAEATDDVEAADATDDPQLEPGEAADDEQAALILPQPPRTETSTARPQDLPGTQVEDEDEAPVPASRKSRRSLRLTGSMSVLSEEKLAELNEIHQAVIASDDPNRVDPELLKKQQALAARAMQANQERRRAEQVEAERDERMRRRRLLPESEVITRKALRAHMESDEAAEHTDYATGSIEPIQARGAHGLEIDAMVEHSTRQGARQSMMGWLVIILAVLLVIAVGVVLSFIL